LTGRRGEKQADLGNGKKKIRWTTTTKPETQKLKIITLRREKVETRGI